MLFFISFIIDKTVESWDRMKAIILKQPGSPEAFEYVDVETPTIKKGWSLVKVQGFGINHSEIFTREGKSPSVQFPRILGIECVGIVVETSDASRLEVGETVISIMGEMGRAFDGSYAEYVLLPNEQIYPVETRLSWKELAAVPETFYTAYGAYLSLQIKDTDSVLVRAATSGVGVAFMKIVKALHPAIRVVGSTRQISKGNMLTDNGFSDVILDQDGKLHTEEKFDKILELIGPATLKNTLGSLRAFGIVCSVGQLGGKWELEAFDPIFELRNHAYLTSFYSGDVSQTMLHDMLRIIEEKKIDVTPEKVFPLDQVADAHRYLEGRGSFGKVVVLNG
ncbi:zinc-containing alcohol dehydrogenase superfamily protein [Listeria cornellensis FSL F6-0969]|uniref:Zinc-containing alcohol dehydrogenase superfamily protein n=2 Tax=Listeria cornellensis TaxID=1494961 RepID=W7C6C7_9LIST|nr:zinc-containing alcohol dehydrogenase superfamily protein [Listeria cornellensis FSL F6-0969]